MKKNPDKTRVKYKEIEKYYKILVIEIIKEVFEDVKFLGALSSQHEGCSFENLKKSGEDGLVFRFLNKDGKLEFTMGNLPFGN